jgi:hypothetical protein
MYVAGQSFASFPSLLVVCTADWPETECSQVLGTQLTHTKGLLSSPSPVALAFSRSCAELGGVGPRGKGRIKKTTPGGFQSRTLTKGNTYVCAAGDGTPSAAETANYCQEPRKQGGPSQRTEPRTI